MMNEFFSNISVYYKRFKLYRIFNKKRKDDEGGEKANNGCE